MDRKIFTPWTIKKQLSDSRKLHTYGMHELGLPNMLPNADPSGIGSQRDRRLVAKMAK
jgi:hypothetical protein